METATQIQIPMPELSLLLRTLAYGIDRSIPEGLEWEKGCPEAALLVVKRRAREVAAEIDAEMAKQHCPCCGRGWISVKDQLPDEGFYVSVGTVTHWQPLSKPPGYVED